MADGRDAVRRLQAARRAHRGERRDWLDASYEIEVRAIFVGVVVFGLPAVLGGDPLAADQLARFRDHAPGVASLLLAIALYGALRSGRHGAPLAPEAPDVTYLLLAPIPRSFVLRRLARRQLLLGCIAGAVIGAATGVAASQRLPGSVGTWAALDLAGGICVAATVWGAVALSSARRMPATVVNMVGALLVAAAAIDLARHSWFAPTSWVTAIALLPAHAGVPAATVVLGVTVGLAVPAFALWSVGGNSVEPLARRSALVSQLRFAASLEDVRTVVLLHRELALEHARRRPWFAVPARRADRFPALRRGWRSYARWPAARVLRTAVLVAAAVALAVAARSTPLLVVAAGLASFVVGLELLEPFAAELDHPTTLLTYGVAITTLIRRNLAAPIAALVYCCQRGV